MFVPLRWSVVSIRSHVRLVQPLVAKRAPGPWAAQSSLHRVCTHHGDRRVCPPIRQLKRMVSGSCLLCVFLPLVFFCMCLGPDCSLCSFQIYAGCVHVGVIIVDVNKKTANIPALIKNWRSIIFFIIYISTSLSILSGRAYLFIKLITIIRWEKSIVLEIWETITKYSAFFQAKSFWSCCYLEISV